MKQAIAFGVIATENDPDDWEVFSITTLAHSRTGRGSLYGRREDGVATHAATGDVYGRYKTLAEAETARDAIRAVHAHHAAAIASAEDYAASLRRVRNETIRAALANIQIDTPVMVTVA